MCKAKWEENGMFYENHKYDDMINLPHHQSEKHAHMDLIDRAAQFSPFAALTGFEDAILETGRITDSRIELEEDEKERLDIHFRKLRECLKEQPLVEICYFEADIFKEGGSYVTSTKRVKRIDENARKIVLVDGTSIEKIGRAHV